MREYALVGPADEIRTFARNVRPDVGTKPGWRWLPVERVADPFDSATEALGPEAIAVEAERVVIARRVRAKTHAERAAEKAAEIDAVAPAALAVLLAEFDNRIRALEKQPARSRDQFRSALEALLE